MARDPAGGAPAPQLNAAAIDDLTARVAGLETKTNKPAAPVADPAAVARMETLEKSLAALRGELAATRAQGEKLASAVNEVKSAPRADGTPAPDLSAVNERLAKIESAVRAQAAEIAQQGSKIADSKAADAKPADDLPLRRVVAAALLDVLVRIGDPYPAALAAAKSLAPNADALKPLDDFAAKGVPSAAKLSAANCWRCCRNCRRLRKPPPPVRASSIGCRQARRGWSASSAPKPSHVGNDRSAIVARVTAAALRNDIAEARRELKTLAPADRAVAQAWIDKADARDAALAASRQFAADAMGAFTKPAQ